MSVLSELTASKVKLLEKDLVFKTCRGSGAGGQHRNTTDSAVQATHRPTGITVRVESERSQHQNKETARALLRAQIGERLATEKKDAQDAKRRKQVGTAERSDKRRTVAFQRGQVVDHRTKRKMSAQKYLKGFIEELWK